jgi:hypothetical protein
LTTWCAPRLIAPDRGRPLLGPQSDTRHRAQSQVADAGVVNWGAAGGEYLEVDDPRALRRHLELKLVASAELRARFLAGLEEALQQHEVLRRALMPLAVLSPSAYATGDSFLRIVLNIPCLQVPPRRLADEQGAACRAAAPRALRAGELVLSAPAPASPAAPSPPGRRLRAAAGEAGRVQRRGVRGGLLHALAHPGPDALAGGRGGQRGPHGQGAAGAGRLPGAHPAGDHR